MRRDQHAGKRRGHPFEASSITELFEKEKDAIELIKWKEIFERIEEAIDVCEDVSNIAEGIVLKNA